MIGTKEVPDFIREKRVLILKNETMYICFIHRNLSRNKHHRMTLFQGDDLINCSIQSSPKNAMLQVLKRSRFFSPEISTLKNLLTINLRYQ